MKIYPASLDATGLHFAVVASRFNHLVTTRLVEGCTGELRKRGADEAALHVAWVPGAFEIPLAARQLAASGRYHAIVALGNIVRGGTPHFEYVCRGVTDGVVQVMRDTRVPVAFGVLTTDDVEQALARAGGSEGNKGEEAALAAIEMARLLGALGEPRGDPVRQQSRQVALQALYAVDVAQRGSGPAPSAEEVFEGIAAHFELPEAARAFAKELVCGTVARREELDTLLATHARNWRVSRMAAVDRNVLRLASYELAHTQTPTEVILDEAIELARRFGDEPSAAFVNGVLDAVARNVRSASPA